MYLLQEKGGGVEPPTTSTKTKKRIHVKAELISLYITYDMIMNTDFRQLWWN